MKYQLKTLMKSKMHIRELRKLTKQVHIKSILTENKTPINLKIKF